MANAPIIVITDLANRAFYETLSIPGEQVMLCDLHESVDSVGRCGCNVMLLDCGRNPETGLKLLARINKCCVSAPVVFLTDTSSEELVIAAFKAGAREYFKRPFDPAELIATVVKLGARRNASSAPRFPTAAQLAAVGSDHPSPSNPGLPDWLLRSVQFMQDNLAEEIYLEHVAKKAGMSKFHFCRTFKDYLGMTPMQYLMVNRIKKAKSLMSNYGTTITSVIYKVGFNDISEFNRQFKKVTGMTPSAFRESLRKEPPEEHCA